MKTRIDHYPKFARMVGEAKPNTSHKSKLTREQMLARRKLHEVACYKCGRKRKVPLGKLNAMLTSYQKKGTDNQGNHFCCSTCIKSGLSEVREATINTADSRKLKEAIKLLKKARKFKAAELLEKKLEEKT